MKRIFARIGLILIVLVVALVIMAFFLPSMWRADETIVIKASKDKIYPLVADLHRWPEWASWYQDNGEYEMRYEGPQMGEGAHSFWSGEKLGKGDLLITKADAHGIEYDLFFSEEDARSKGAILLNEQGDQTTVRWHNEGDLGKNPLMRYMGLLISKMVGEDFAKGLSKLKEKVESLRRDENID